MNNEMTEILTGLRKAAIEFLAPLERLEEKVEAAVETAQAWLDERPYYPSERFDAFRSHESWGLSTALTFGQSTLEELIESSADEFTVTLTHRNEHSYETYISLTMSEIENIIPALERDFAPTAAAIKKRELAELKAKEQELEENLAAVRASIKEVGAS